MYAYVNKELELDNDEFLLAACDVVTHILPGRFTGTGTIIQLLCAN